MARLDLTVADAAALRALFDGQLSKRRAFLPDALGVEPQTACELCIVHGSRSHRLTAEVVYVKAEEPGRGVGLQLAPLDANALAELRAFVDAATDDAPAEAPQQEADEEQRASPPAFHERIRSLSGVEQQKLAAIGTLSERIAIERMFGPNVWETLLRNTRITIPEVARIARKGTLPRPLVESIAANATWVATGEVQRALLSNPRSTMTVVSRVLQALSRGDLARASMQTAYPMTVRNAAKKLMGG